MITVNGYKAYSGKMRIYPKNNAYEPFDLYGDFLYKPDTDCWYHDKESYPSEICEVRDE